MSIPRKNSAFPATAFWKRLGWKKLFGGFSILLVLLLVLSPEIAVFSFLLDAAVIETVIFLIGMQLRNYWTGIVLSLSSVTAAITRRFKTK